MRRYDTDELIDFAEDEADPAWVDDFFDTVGRCQAPSLGDCYAREGTSLEPVDCTDPSADLVLRQGGLVRPNPCEFYDEAWMIEGRTYCMDEL